MRQVLGNGPFPATRVVPRCRKWPLACVRWQLALLTMEIRDIRPSEIEAARRLLNASGWTHRVSDPEEFRELVSRSQRALVAVDGDEVIGFLRALCDGMANGYISMLV